MRPQRILGSKKGFYKVSYAPLIENGAPPQETGEIPSPEWVPRSSVPQYLIDTWRDFRAQRRAYKEAMLAKQDNKAETVSIDVQAVAPPTSVVQELHQPAAPPSVEQTAEPTSHAQESETTEFGLHKPRQEALRVFARSMHGKNDVQTMEPGADHDETMEQLTDASSPKHSRDQSHEPVVFVATGGELPGTTTPIAEIVGEVQPAEAALLEPHLLLREDARDTMANPPAAPLVPSEPHASTQEPGAAPGRRSARVPEKVHTSEEDRALSHDELLYTTASLRNDLVRHREMADEIKNMYADASTKAADAVMQSKRFEEENKQMEQKLCNDLRMREEMDYTHKKMLMDELEQTKTQLAILLARDANTGDAARHKAVLWDEEQERKRKREKLAKKLAGEQHSVIEPVVSAQPSPPPAMRDALVDELDELAAEAAESGAPSVLLGKRSRSRRVEPEADSTLLAAASLENHALPTASAALETPLSTTHVTIPTKETEHRHMELQREIPYDAPEYEPGSPRWKRRKRAFSPTPPSVAP
ncbi:hypothetical protein MVES1_003982 [Malassezia vespertilionis]|nr:uncharacterized protein MVES1_003982 [Malassezia vespertilionis]WFD08606.1 hypothetical protein MVES1_003982 [Malassezia vespertilionis]